MAKAKGLSKDQVQLIAKALGDPRRYEILRRLAEQERPTACEEMRDCMTISPPTLSHHMKELETAGLVRVERKGRFAYYEVDGAVMEAFFKRLRKDVFGRQVRRDSLFL